ncbi:MAG: acetyl-CoA carboxylase carboxyltransferase subunit alpha [Gallicola sp.]|nr:acetyl-CoA carboxylase carboxyltransferase subunit alpha [Gallicola sp.]
MNVRDLELKINSLDSKASSKKEELLEDFRKQIKPKDRVDLARLKQRPKTKEIIEEIIDDPLFFHGDRFFSEDPSIVGGVGGFNGRSVTFIGTHKGVGLDESVRNNFGMPGPEGYRKAVRLMKQAEKFGRPIFTFIDTPGAYPGIGAEERGQGSAIANAIMEMSGLKVPIICVITGEGCSGGALAIGVGNRILMMENAVYSVLSPEGFASILWKDASRAEEATEVMKLTAEDLLENGIIHRIIPETITLDKKEFLEHLQPLKDILEEELKALLDLSPEELIKNRSEHFNNIGRF